MHKRASVLNIGVLLFTLITLSCLYAKPAVAAETTHSANLSTTRMQAQADERIDDLLGLPWSSLPFVAADGQAGIAVSEAKPLNSSFESSITYQGKHFSSFLPKKRQPAMQKKKPLNPMCDTDLYAASRDDSS